MKGVRMENLRFL